MQTISFASLLEAVKRWWVPVLVFLLPWQVVWIVSSAPVVNGTPWDLGTIRLFFVPFLIVLTACLFWRRLARLPRFLMWLTLVLPSFGWLSTLWAPDVVLAVQQAFYLSVAALLVLLMLAEPRREHVRFAFVLTLCVQALLALLQFGLQRVDASTLLGVAAQIPTQLGVSVIDLSGVRFLRASGTFPHPNILGAWLVAGVLFIFTPLMCPPTRLKRMTRLLWLCALGLLSLGLVVTFSRSALLALCVGAITWFGVVLFRRELVFSRLLIAPAVLMVGVAVLVLVFFRPFLNARTDFSDRLEQRSVNDRVQTIQDGWDAVVRAPLLGTGVGNFGVVLKQHDSARTGYLLQPPHIALLALTAELGVIGFVLLIGAWVWKLMRLRRSWKSLAPFLPFLLFLLMISFFDHFLYTLWPGLALSAFVGSWAVARFFRARPVVENTRLQT